VRAVAFIAGTLPRAWLGRLGRIVGWFAGSLLRVRRVHVLAMLRRAQIPAPTDVARAMYASLGTGLVELVWLSGRAPDAVASMAVMTPAAERALTEAIALGRGVVLATAHTGNWDLGALALARWLSGAGRRLHVITKRLSIRWLDRYWQRLRAERGVVLVDARGAWAHARVALGAGDVVAVLVDQAPERRSGVRVLPFLGEPARHDLAPVLLAARSRAPLVVGFARRAADGSHLIDVVDVIESVSRDDASLLAATERITAALERFIRAHPAQWLWLHKRWKGVEER
jgi:KDO2-lipid IV(A) lauroyltransferase